MIKLIDSNNIVCEICKQVYTTKCKFTLHIQNVHSITPLQYTLKFLLKNEIPLCKCGCKTPVKYYKYTVNKYRMGHSGGGFWQHKYEKNSPEYLDIVNKIKVSTSKSMLGIPKTKKHSHNISIGRKKWIRKNKKKFNMILDKMRHTKEKQSKSGILSKQHYVNVKSKKEIIDIYTRISKSSSKTKQRLKQMNKYPVVWNKGKTKLTDKRVAKYSGQFHYNWNPNKDTVYTKLFYDAVYRKLILKRQDDKCFLCNSTTNLCLHHIDEDKKNDNSKNLVFLCRKHHRIVHNNISNYTFNINEEIDMGFLNKTTITVDAIE